MASSDQEIVSQLLPFVQVYKNGRVERFLESEKIPPSLQDPKTGVSSKDIKISSNPDISARLYLPPSKLIATTDEKLPLLLFFHGGAFCIESAFSLFHQRYLNAVVSQANVVVVSVEYRLAPEYPLPIAYEDCWTSFQWVLAQSKNDGHELTFAHGFKEEPWLKDNVDFNRVFLGGDSAGANIAHNLAMRAAENQSTNVIRGICLVHPYFWGSEPIGSEIDMDLAFRALAENIWLFVYPSAKNGVDDPMCNPFAPGAPSISSLGCKRVLVCVAGKDPLKDRGRFYYEELKRSGWKGGEIELFESEEDEHEFHLYNPDGESAQLLFKCVASFLNK